MSDDLHVTIRYEDGGDGFIMASVTGVPGAISQGRTREEARANVLGALRLLLTPDADADADALGESEVVVLRITPDAMLRQSRSCSALPAAAPAMILACAFCSCYSSSPPAS